MYLLDTDIIAIIDSIKDIFHIFNGKRILITGGQGFIGQYVCAAINHLNEKYLKSPCEVIVIDNLITSGNKQTIPKYNNFKYIIDDVENNVLFSDKIDYIIFLAGIASPFYYRKHPIKTITTVSIGLLNYLEVAKLHNAKLLFTSSSEIYGDTDGNNIPTKETYNGNVSTSSDRSCYDESKRLGETLCYLYSQFQVDTVVVRLFNVFGPAMQSTDYRVLPNFAFNIFNNKPVLLYGDGQQTRTFCYVSDSISGIFKTLLLGKSGQIYNIGNPKPEISISNLLDLCQKVLIEEKIDHPLIIKKIVSNPKDYPVKGDSTRRCPDIIKATSELMFLPKVSLFNGLTKFLNWASKYYV